MSEGFDPYHEWLAIPPSEQPPNHYRLLGTPLFEGNPTVIENAADQRMAHLRTFQAGRRSAASQKLLNEVAAARVCLLNAQKKAAYDQRLRQQLAAAEPNPPPDPSLLPSIATPFQPPRPHRSSTLRRGPRFTVMVTAGALALAIAAMAAVWLIRGRSPGSGPAMPPADPSALPVGSAAKGPDAAAPSPSSAEATRSPSPAIAPFDARQARTHQEAWARHLGVPVEIINSVGMKLALIPPGEFTMGSPPEFVEEARRGYSQDPLYRESLLAEGPRHTVRISRPFYLGATEVTQRQYRQVLGENPSDFSTSGRRKAKVGGQDTECFPVENLSWKAAAEFCSRLSELPAEKTAGREYGLPTEAQWEYACRAGSDGLWHFSAATAGRGTRETRRQEEGLLSEFGWYSGNSSEQPHAVGQKRANAWGLHDLYGNVWEPCRDQYDDGYYATSVRDDPAGPAAGSLRVFRGGGWNSPSRRCRSAHRGNQAPESGYNGLGLRISLTVSQEQAVRAPPERSY